MAGFWETAARRYDRHMTRFMMHRRTYSYERVQVGLRNAPQTFQRALEIILLGVCWKNVQVYLDDEIIRTNNRERKSDALYMDHEPLGREWIALKVNKCSLLI